MKTMELMDYAKSEWLKVCDQAPQDIVARANWRVMQTDEGLSCTLGVPPARRGEPLQHLLFQVDYIRESDTVVVREVTW